MVWHTGGVQVHRAETSVNKMHAEQPKTNKTKNLSFIFFTPLLDKGAFLLWFAESVHLDSSTVLHFSMMIHAFCMCVNGYASLW